MLACGTHSVLSLQTENRNQQKPRSRFQSKTEQKPKQHKNSRTVIAIVINDYYPLSQKCILSSCALYTVTRKTLLVSKTVCWVFDFLTEFCCCCWKLMDEGALYAAAYRCRPSITNTLWYILGINSLADSICTYTQQKYTYKDAINSSKKRKKNTHKNFQLNLLPSKWDM